ncbi:hypothetical protein ACFYO7_28085, partial [Nocardia salmonicida]|uniref:hypothetical protein n=1 Tax=Nocardia salmonicida TaxID=53431 RepID=UPI0036CA4740
PDARRRARPVRRAATRNGPGAIQAPRSWSTQPSWSGLERRKGESVQSLLARVWSAFDEADESNGWRRVDQTLGDVGEFGEEPVTTDEPALDHNHIDIGEGRKVCPAIIYGFLSEFIHAKTCAESFRWESIDRLDERAMTFQAVAVVRCIEEAMALCMLQINMIAAAVAHAYSRPDLAQFIFAAPKRFSTKSEDEVEDPHPLTAFGHKHHPTPRGPVTPPMPALAPLLPLQGLKPESTRVLQYLTDLYRMAMLEKKRPAGRLYRDDEIVTFIFTSHRLGSALTAQTGLVDEQRLLGSDFDIDGLHHRGTQITLVTEFAAMCARWSFGNAKLMNACAMVSTSLRTAFWLWLEDDDRAMALLRCTLEQIARVKVWHTKPSKAEHLETNPATTPRDWIVEAGWRRLAALNRAFGEFAHAHTNPRWDGARLLLVELQIDPDSDTASRTGRRAALELMATLVARTCVELIEAEHSATIGSTARRLFAEHMGFDMTPGDRSLDTILDHIWQYRSHPLVQTPYPITTMVQNQSQTPGDPR